MQGLRNTIRKTYGLARSMVVYIWAWDCHGYTATVRVSANHLKGCVSPLRRDDRVGWSSSRGMYSFVHWHSFVGHRSLEYSPDIVFNKVLFYTHRLIVFSTAFCSYRIHNILFLSIHSKQWCLVITIDVMRLRMVFYVMRKFYINVFRFSCLFGIILFLIFKNWCQHDFSAIRCCP